MQHQLGLVEARTGREDDLRGNKPILDALLPHGLHPMEEKDEEDAPDYGYEKPNHAFKFKRKRPRSARCRGAFSTSPDMPGRDVVGPSLCVLEHTLYSALECLTAPPQSRIEYPVVQADSRAADGWREDVDQESDQPGGDGR